jgi:hypothetical protein
MKSATVTINYESFQTIKTKADMHDKAKQEQREAGTRIEEFTNFICDCIEKANKCKTAEEKQYYIALGIRKICKHYEWDIATEYPGLDTGLAPEAGEDK